jgi:protein-L-isoaspartate O-methyltransferase
LEGEAEEGAAEHADLHGATYSPEDNKLRLYPVARLDPETYQRVKAAGFTWAPRQELFVAPMWTPEREDLLLDLCGEIEDEGTSLAERADQRAERFGDYRERRAVEAQGARQAVEAVAQRFEFGQPIIVGHHSERRARRDADRIENGMRKAVNLWRTSEYWKSRAAGVLRHATYKERPDVRARRIKTLEADRRREERSKARAEGLIRLWAKDALTTDQAAKLAWVGHAFETARELEKGIKTADQAREERVPVLRAVVVRCERWIEHLGHRLAYERELLTASGWTPPVKPRTKASLPLLNYAGKVRVRSTYRKEIEEYDAVPMTKAELAKIHSDYKGTRVSEDGTHRVRIAMVRSEGAVTYSVVFLTDSKQHARPGVGAIQQVADLERVERDAAVRRKLAALDERQAVVGAAAPARAEEETEAAPFRAMAQSLEAGVQVVSAPQLFPTPAALAAEMVSRAGLASGQRVLEPSAGTGELLRAISNAAVAAALTLEVVAVEISACLVEALPRSLAGETVTGDFLTFGLGRSFDRIVMNPPFERAADVAHVLHAYDLLAPGGRLVAVVADGPRQNERLGPWVSALGGSWEQLPADTFKVSGTTVRTALIVVGRP